MYVENCIMGYYLIVVWLSSVFRHLSVVSSDAGSER